MNESGTEDVAKEGESNISDLLIEKSHIQKSLLVVGLDPRVENLPDCLVNNHSLNGYCEAIFHFNKIIIDAVYRHVVAVKPQLACYEVFGSQGILALEQSIEYAKKKGLLVINDAKRGDIGSTAELYATAFLGDGPLGGDFTTVNPYLGSDGYRPFIEKAKINRKGLFLLLKTSNASAGDFQDQVLRNGEMLYMHFAAKLKKLCAQTKGLRGYSYIGAVVGATYRKQAESLRKLLPETLFLMPGFGYQGGDEKVIPSLLDQDGNGILYSSSRGIIYSYIDRDKEWKKITESLLKECIEENVLHLNRRISEYR